MINIKEVKEMVREMNDLLSQMNDSLLSLRKFSCDREKQEFIDLMSSPFTYYGRLYLGYDTYYIDPRFLPYIVGHEI